MQQNMNSKGQGHLMALAKGQMSVVCQNFPRASPLKLRSQFHLNFTCCLVAKKKGNTYMWLRSHDQDGRHAHIW